MSKCEDKAQRLGPLEMVSVSDVHGQPPIRETTQRNEKVNRMRLDEKLMSGWIFPTHTARKSCTISHREKQYENWPLMSPEVM